MGDQDEFIRKLRNRINIQQTNAKDYKNEAEKIV